jgi:5-(carboxyamino)imidazole ribonucleotide mutase
MKSKVLILMGSERDLEFCREIAKHLTALGLDYVFRVCSAHKTPEKVLEIIRESEDDRVVYITVAGKSNALSPFVDANTSRPVIACPPYSEKFAGADIYSSLRVPSGVAPLLVLEPEGAAIAAAKILALDDPSLTRHIKDYQRTKKTELEKADESIKKLR